VFPLRIGNVGRIFRKRFVPVPSTESSCGQDNPPQSPRSSRCFARSRLFTMRGIFAHDPTWEETVDVLLPCSQNTISHRRHRRSALSTSRKIQISIATACSDCKGHEACFGNGGFNAIAISFQQSSQSRGCPVWRGCRRQACSLG
jgi:hypothetical protein